MFAFFKALLAREPARFASYVATLASAGLLVVASKFGVDFSPEFLLGFSGFMIVLATEVIRLLVVSPDTHAKALESAVGGAVQG